MKRSSFLPDILPADPSAPEGYRHRRQPVKYGVLGRIVLWFEARATRTALSQLNEATLKDIGYERDMILGDSTNSFWDVPVNWRSARKNPQLFSIARAA
ncbi:MAG: DUF1127 domain-containing protein [Boseongicola sp.]|nr:DUF1127 domain-containing protein [Boseongicola sp.]